ncbi:hypothetical protein BCV69DRAFT_296458 [Microstroma glucosiphilum]|uniref:Cytochrome c oxidase assembly protein PET191 n=1 Tax=Pseudomicrostroma glucosiphilum TaxID=1684307 RepID=A0A316UFR4_9BASI|nr:hypothetical protein BCV69DRAFT_296458 [Pseudomicrostroma glucosiphilum]PWN24167.1 hypothetical protein BCV69DRAFT_296458 [Pseudomicrostroma glucosiphilum]
MNSCQSIRDDLASCLLASPCVQEQGKSAQDCLRNEKESLPLECQNIYKSYVACKRGMLDMRKRFRGNAPAATKRTNAPGGTSQVDSAAVDTA